MGRIRKTLVLFLLLGGAYLYVEHVNPGIIPALFELFRMRYPVAAKLVEAGILHAQKGTLVGVSLVMFTSRLPFAPFPPEPYILFAYTGENLFRLAGAAAVFGTAGATVSYTIGRVLGKHAFNEAWIRRIKRWHHSIFLPVAVFLAAALPIPDVSSFLFGAGHTPFRTFVLYSFLGFIVWVAGLVLLMQYAQGSVFVVPGVNETVNLSATNITAG